MLQKRFGDVIGAAYQRAALYMPGARFVAEALELG
jgi:hypothetical protein